MGGGRRGTVERAPDLPPGILRELFEQAPGFVAITIGPSHVFEYVNAAFRALVDDRDLIGRPFFDALPELAEQGFKAVRDNVFRTGAPVRTGPARFDLRDPELAAGSERYIDAIYYPISREDGVVVGIFFTGYDITEQRAAQEQVELLKTELIHVSRGSAMGTMATTLAHELNQPLTAISSYLAGSKRLLERGGEGNIAQAREALEMALSSAHRAGEIIRGLREMTMRGGTKRIPVDLTETVSEAVRLALVGTEQSGLVSHISLESGLMVEADRIHIQQVVLNLVKNAIEAMAGRPVRELTVRVSAEGDMARLCVGDTGTGLAPAVRETLFEPFFTTKEGGMGIGLPISRTIIESHGGQLWAEDREGGGTLFIFTLPLVDTAAAENTERPAS